VSQSTEVDSKLDRPFESNGSNDRANGTGKGDDPCACSVSLETNAVGGVVTIRKKRERERESDQTTILNGNVQKGRDK
jgi:hypothetical protein